MLKILLQLQYECDAWKRLLAFLMDENIHLKNRLSEIVKDRDGTTSLSLIEIERFQTNFLKGDELIKVLRDDISEVDKLLRKEFFEDGIIEKKIKTKFNKIRVNIPLAERQLDQLKKEFNSYLLANA
jgi:hypothetical protein